VGIREEGRGKKEEGRERNGSEENEEGGEKREKKKREEGRREEIRENREEGKKKMLVVEPDYLPDSEVFVFQLCLYPMKTLHPRRM
jgi:hypothetical protein